MSAREHQSLGKPNVLDVFIERPLLAVVLCIALVLLGARSASDMAVLEFPQIESSSLIITTPYVGASAETIQGFVTDPIERAAATIPGVDYIESSTTPGVSVVTVWLKLNESSTLALAELTARLSQIRFELPAGAEDPAIRVERADAANAIFYLDFDFGSYSIAEASDYLTRSVMPVFTAIPGVLRVDMISRDPSMRVWLDPARLNFFNISAQQVQAALASNNVIAPLGYSENQQQRIELQSNATLQNVEEFEQLIIAERNDAIVRLKDVAQIELAELEVDTIGRINQRENIWLAVYGLPGANELEIGDALYEVMDELQSRLPGGMQISIGFDGTVYMRDALREIFTTLAETVLLVGLVVLLFMGSVRSAMVPLLTIPISLLGAVAVMQAMGFSFNLLTILAIVLSVGLVVDDAIVVVENVGRYMRDGMSRMEAALASSRQLLTPIIGMTLTLAAVYLPIGFLSGLTGVLIKEFAFTLAVAVLLSGVVALTLSPIMSAYANPPRGEEGRMTRWVNERFDHLRGLYQRSLDHSLLLTPQILVFALFFSLLSVPLLLFSQQELAPIEDESAVFAIVEAPAEASLDYTRQHMHDVVAVLNDLPGATFMWQVVSPSFAFGGQEFVPPDQRDQTPLEMLPSIFQQVSQIPSLRVLPNVFPSLPSAGQFDVEFIVTSAAPIKDMAPYAQQLIEAAYASNQFLFADTTLKIDLPQVRFVFDRERIADLGLSVNDVSEQLAIYLSANYVNRFDLNGRAYRVIPQVADHDRRDIESILQIHIQTPDGAMVPLSSLATVEHGVGPRLLSKFQQRNSFSIRGGLIPGVTKEQGLRVLEEAAAEIIPADYLMDYAGESRQIRQEGNTLFGALAFALAFVFLVLVVLFNSLRDPLVVLLGCVPLALAGAMLFTFLGWTTINIYSQIGFITLVGLVTKNGILIVEFANHLQQQGLSKLEAIKAGACTRLRPVLMTTGATVIGHFPLVLVTGAGAEARNSIGIILVAGMIIGTLFTLYVLPSVYLVFASRHEAEEVGDEGSYAY